MSDDSTNKTPTTRPTIETILERINQLGAQLTARIDESASEVRNELSALRTEMRDGFKKLDRRLDVLIWEDHRHQKESARA